MVLAICVNACLGSFFFGYGLGVANLAWKTLTYAYGIEDDSNTQTLQGLFTAALSLGAGMGALSVSQFLEHIGRRQFLLLTDIISILGTALFIFDNVWVDITARFISGLCIGFNSAIVPIYINEISPRSISGLTGSFNQLFINICIIGWNIFGIFFPLEYSELKNTDGFYWRFVLMFPLLTCALRIILLSLLFRFETPHYSISKGKDADVRTFVKMIYLPEAEDAEYDKI